ncbi:MAG: hypothetical protein L0216_20390 [Planctomycetales bacterium]|nr:hypothetical protein [Planctomycetales bacterium]
MAGPSPPPSPRRPRPLQRARRFVAAALARAGIALFSRLPRALGQPLGAALGHLGYYANGRERRRAVAHLGAAFPDWPPARHRAVARAMFRHVGRSAADVVRATRLPAEKLRALVVNVDDLARTILADADEGAGLVVLTAHFGNWELIGAVGNRIRPLTVVARRPHDPRLSAIAESLRARLGFRVVYQDDSPRELLRVLRERQFVGILPDQDVRDLPGVFVPYFGTEAWTPVAPLSVARAAGAALRPIFLVREGSRYRALIHERIPVPPREAGEEGLRAATLAWTRVLEADVRERPEQWMWMHRRWRTRPGDVQPRAQAPG